MKKKKSDTKVKNRLLIIYLMGKALHYFNWGYLLFHILPHVQMRGLYRGLYSLLFLVSALDLQEAVLRFGASKSISKKRLLGWLIFCYTLLLVLSMGMLFVTQLFYRQSQTYLFHHLGLILLGGYLIQMAKLLKSWGLLFGKVFVPNILQNIFIEMVLTLGFLLYSHSVLSFGGLLYFLLLPYGLHLTIMGFYLGKQGFLQIDWRIHQLGKNFYRSFLDYGALNALVSKCMILVKRLDLLWLALLWGDGKVACYTDILLLAALLEMPSKVNRQVVTPKWIPLLTGGKHVDLLSTYQKSLSWSFWGAGSLFLLFLYNLTWFPFCGELDHYQNLFLIVGVGKVAESLFAPSILMLMLSSHFRSLLYAFMGLLPLLAINFLCIQKYSLYGAAWGISLTLTIWGGLAAFLVRYHLKLSFFSKRLFFLGLWFLTFSLLGVLFPQGEQVSLHLLRLATPLIASAMAKLFI